MIRWKGMRVNKNDRSIGSDKKTWHGMATYPVPHGGGWFFEDCFETRMHLAT